MKIPLDTKTIVYIIILINSWMMFAILIISEHSFPFPTLSNIFFRERQRITISEKKILKELYSGLNYLSD